MLVSFWRKLAWKRMARAAVWPGRPALRVEGLEDRLTPAGVFAVPSAAGAAASVAVFDAASRQLKFTLSPFPGFTDGVNAAVGDVNGDGTADVIVAPQAGGGPVVNVYSGVDGTLLKTFPAGDDSSRAGVSVAAADFDADGLADVVVGTVRNGQPLVQVFKFSDLTVLKGYTPFEGTAGVNVAAADVTGDGTPDVVAGAGMGGAPRVVVFDGRTDAPVRSFFAFEPTFAGGVGVSAGDVNGDGRADILTAAGPLGGPRVQLFSGLDGSVISNFFAYSADLRAGVQAALADADGNGTLDIVTLNGPGQPTEPKAFDARTMAQLANPTGGGLIAAASWDTVAPTVNLTTGAADPTRTTSMLFTATFNEPVNAFSAAGVTVTNGTAGSVVRVDAKTYTFSVTPTADGPVTVRVNAGAASDAAGNGNTASATVSRTFDGTGPTVTANGQTTNDTTPTLTGTVSDPTATVSVLVGGQTVVATVSGTNWSATVPTALAGGTYTVTATATDPPGNTGTATATLVIDTTAPAAPTITGVAPDTGTSATDGVTNTGNLAVSGTAEPGSTVTLLSGANNLGTATADATTGAWSKAFTLAPGSYSLTATAADTSGNTSGPSTAFAVIVDATAPTVTLTAPAATNDTTPDVTVTATDTGGAGVPDGTAVAVDVDTDGDGDFADAGETGFATGTLTAGTVTITLPALGTGPHLMRARVSDRAGNAGTSTTATVVVDTSVPVPPSITGVAPDTGASATDGVTNTGALTVSGMAEPGSTVALSDGVTPLGTTTADATTGAWSKAVTLAEGSHSLAATASDAAGNTSGPSNTFTVVVDTTAPVGTTITGVAPDTGTSATDGVTNTGTLTVSGTAELGSTVTVLEGTTTVGTATADATTGVWSATVTLAEGSHDLTAKATDAAGNTGPASATFTVVVDTTAPDTTITAQPSALTTSTTADFTWSGFDAGGSGVASYEYRLDGGAWTPTTATTVTLTGLSDGTHTFDVRAIDAAGNTDPTPASYTWSVDTTAPAVAVMSVTDPIDSSNQAATSASGTTEVGAAVTVTATDGTTTTAPVTAVVDGSGNWSANGIDVSGLANGTITYTATATDPAGNTAIASLGATKA